jgi:hypothetical protein
MSTSTATTEQIVREASAEADKPVVVETDAERRERFRTTGFHRMSLDWKPDDKIMMDRIHQVVEARLFSEYADLFALWYDLLARTGMLETDADGNPVPDARGLPALKRSSAVEFAQHADRLSTKERERFLLQINTSMLDWEMRKSTSWAEAMMAKAVWEEQMALGVDEGPSQRSRPTIPEREANGKIESSEARYFAIFQSYYSRSADGIVAAMRGIEQRLKDIHMAASGRG